MPQFVYQARDSASQLVNGQLEADSEYAALNILTRRGFFPIRLHEASTATQRARKRSWRAPRVPVRDLATFTRHLADLMGAGLPLLSALDLLGKQTVHPLLRNVILELEDAVRGGVSLSEALSQHPTVFASLYTNMVRAGELGGALEEVLNRLADFAEAQDELQVKVRTALAYPTLILIVGVLTVTVLLTFVIPKLVALFEEMGQALPLPTRILLMVSRLTVRFGWLLLVGAIAGMVWIRRTAKTPEGKWRLDRIMQRIPVVGDLIRQVELARMARSLGMLLSHGAPLLESLEVVARGSGNAVLQRDLGTVRDAVASGTALAVAMTQSQFITPAVTNMTMGTTAAMTAPL